VIKAFAKSKEKGSPDLCVIGLESRNIELLKLDQPIAINLKDLGGDDFVLCITYCAPGSSKAAGVKVMDSLIVFNDDTFEEILSGGTARVELVRKGESKAVAHLVLSFVKNKADFTKDLITSGMISPHTIVRNEGYSQSDIYPNWN
jgi:hypothetical protein